MNESLERLISECYEDETNIWQDITAKEFLEGYSEKDAIYDKI
ncbi:hypothetical protein MCHI_000552 [Candidatus Magnetoovum chiemensis]|nr:hypothetical protein MCHI_000552 [Candidatus Magnetoovum chiemensis]